MKKLMISAGLLLALSGAYAEQRGMSSWLGTNETGVEYRWKREDWGSLDPSCTIEVRYTEGRAKLRYRIIYDAPRQGRQTRTKVDYGVSETNLGGDGIFSCSAVWDVEVDTVEKR